NGSGTQQQFTAASFAAFTGPAGTVTVDAGGVTSNGVEFDSDGYVVSGGTLTLGNFPGMTTNNNTIGVINAGDTATINAPIAGTSGLQKTGTGTLVLGSTSSTFTGGVKIGSGTLVVTSDGNLGDASNFVKLSGGTLKINAGGDLQVDPTHFALSGGHAVQGVGGGVDVGAGNTLTINGNINMTG